MKLNKRQKELLIKVLCKEWEKIQWEIFNLNMQSRNERSSNFNKKWQEKVQYLDDIEKIIDLCNDDILKKVYFLSTKEKIQKEQDEEYHEIMSNK